MKKILSLLLVAVLSFSFLSCDTSVPKDANSYTVTFYKENYPHEQRASSGYIISCYKVSKHYYIIQGCYEYIAFNVTSIQEILILAHEGDILFSVKEEIQHNFRKKSKTELVNTLMEEYDIEICDDYILSNNVYYGLNSSGSSKYKRNLFLSLG